VLKKLKPIFISDLEEAALPLEEYSSLQEFFVRALKEGSRPIDPDPKCLVTGNFFLNNLSIQTVGIFSASVTFHLV